MADTENKEDNVVSLSAKREEKTTAPVEAGKSESSFDLEAIMKANQEKSDRLKKDRDKANTSVKRSYRLTPKK